MKLKFSDIVSMDGWGENEKVQLGGSASHERE